MPLKAKLKEELSFFKGNYLILVVSWILMDFAHEIPGTYYSDYVIQLGGSPSILGVISFASLLTFASVQFLGGYLADKYGRRWLISTLTFGCPLLHLLCRCSKLAFHPHRRHLTEHLPSIPASLKRHNGGFATT